MNKYCCHMNIIVKKWHKFQNSGRDLLSQLLYRGNRVRWVRISHFWISHMNNYCCHMNIKWQSGTNFKIVVETCCHNCYIGVIEYAESEFHIFGISPMNNYCCHMNMRVKKWHKFQNNGRDLLINCYLWRNRVGLSPNFAFWNFSYE